MYKKCDYKEKDDKDKEYLENIYTYKMPKEIREASFKNIYKDDSNRLETIKYLKKFYDNYKKGEKIKGLYLYGNFGCGKTYLVSALFNELAKKDIRSTIIYFPEFLRSLKASFGNIEDNYEERFDAVKEANLLLLDDIGAEKLSDWARDEVLGVILQYRMEEHLPTFFTSNLSLKDLEEHLQIGRSSEDKIKARRIIERVKYLSDAIEMNSINRRG
jgi:primosomal protein DnaI